MDMYGGKIGDNGGEGGYSRIRFTMKQNEEYVLTGLNSPIDAPFLYRKGTLIAVVASGGHAGKDGSTGGDGGGIQVAGGTGKGSDGGSARWNDSAIILRRGLDLNGIFGGAYFSPILYPGDAQQGGGTGGQTIRCAKGVYFAEQGIGACADIGESQQDGSINPTQFRLPNGTIVTNTASITRGFKAGYNIMQTAGMGLGSNYSTILSGQGGHGATGGNGGVNGGGGGGGAGYTDGSVTVVDTQAGGSTGACKVVIRAVT